MIHNWVHKNTDNKRFFIDCPSYLKTIGIYIWGDSFIFIPFHILIFLFSLISLRFGLLLWAVFFSIRSLGEVLYWFLQQFGDRKYRPYDFGFKKLDNHAIYIYYQTIMTVHATVSIAALIIFIKFWEVLPATYTILFSTFIQLKDLLK
ncbi:MAG TPA: hypothetical protein PLS49_09130 [Candidatus Woesebacteria bacterium]|nr:hypothetical protein [Candidatus Woesebacteria bacterium]